MNQYETAILTVFVVLFLPTFALYHLMVFRINKYLAPDRRIPHSTSFLRWRRLGESYKEFYPRSSLYSLARSSAFILLFIAAAMVVFRVWGFCHE
jgi:hypothetical protein